jgi:2-C-methyl-D-erythritol 2,4-cyclodiphosphate synthase
MGKGDIGEHFPNTEAQYRNIASLKLFEQVLALVKKNGYKINNIDTVVLAEAPNLKAYKQTMRRTIAKTASLAEDAVNIKATTTEGLGAIGRKEGISAYATVLLSKE